MAEKARWKLAAITAKATAALAVEWHKGLPLDDLELCATVHEVYNRPGWGDGIAETYAANLPPVSKPPTAVSGG
jgi:hypothetical protein